jgi:hypothetical protein
MYRKFVGLISLVLLLGWSPAVWAQAYTWDDGAGGGDHYWSTPNNWEPNALPDVNAVSIPAVGQEINYPVIQAGKDVNAALVYIVGNTSPGFAIPRLTLQSGAKLRARADPPAGQTLGVGMGWGGDGGILINNGGDINTATAWIGYRLNSNKIGVVNMTGGYFLCTRADTSALFEIARTDDCGGGVIASYGHVHLSGGTIDTQLFTMRGVAWSDTPGTCTATSTFTYGDYPQSKGWMDINGANASLIIRGDPTATDPQAGNFVGTIINYNNNGWLTAYGEGSMDDGTIVSHPRARLLVDFDQRVVRATTVTAYKAGPGEAYDLNSMPYAVNVDPKVTLTWKPGDYVRYGGDYNGIPNAQKGNGHHVFIHTKFDPSWNLNYEVGTKFGHLVGAQDANSFDVTSAEANLPGRALQLDTIYYWCVIEANDHNVAPIQWTYKSLAQRFKTVGGKASSPNPGTGSEVGIYVGEPLQLLLSWNRGFYAAGTNGHKVYFGTDYNDVNWATEVNTPYQGTRTEPNWLATGLVLDGTYYWRIDEVSTTGPDPNYWKGDTWSFKVGKYRVVDAFDSDGSDNDLRARWKDNYLDGSACALWGTGEELYSTTGGQSGRGMRFEYDNNDRVCAGPAPCGYSYFSEARLEYASGKNWTYGDGSTTLRALALSYQGNANNQVNGADPDLDRMYVAVESTNGKMAIVWNEDPNTQQKTGWQEWNILLSDFNEINDVNTASVKYLYIGFGVRCDPESGVRGLPGGQGSVLFDNIRLYPRRCVGLPGFRMLGDLGGAAGGLGDCDVNMADVKVLVGNWLTVDRLSGVPVVVANNDPCLMARWTFEGDCNNDLVNSKMKAKANGKMYGTPSIVYDAVRDSNVLYCDQNELDVNDYVLCGTWGQDGNFAGRSFTLMCWAKQTELSNETSGWAGMITKGEAAQKLEYGFVPSLMRQVHFATHMEGTTSAAMVPLGEWHHLAGTYQQLADANGGYKRVYIDGRLSVSNAPNSRPYTDINELPYKYSHNPAYDPNWCIGALDEEGNMTDNPPIQPLAGRRPFHGYLDDVRVYDRRLTEEEVMYIAGLGPTVKNYYPFLSTQIDSDIYSPEAPGSKKINFPDLAKLAQDWMRQDVLWPVD